MRYTRYDLKRKKSKSTFFVLLILGILVLAFISGSIISNLFIKDIGNDSSGKNNIKNNDQIKINPSNKEDNKQSIKDIKGFVVIQCGVFTNKSNAETLKNKLISFGNPFIVDEEGKSKVILGIYSDSEAEQVIKKLEDSKTEFSKWNLSIDYNNLCNAQIAEIIDARLQIIHKLTEDKVKSVQTKQIKEWSTTLKDIDKSSTNYDVFKNLQEDIKKLPEQITKEGVEDNNIYLYKKISELK